ncbi:MAG: lysine 2,3-aminomutase [Deltaproteobacteria bacterium CG17_big_fil_post_rev_8_21_14_2_50_63_7]|nr:MAG: lysine 2,3-aminomutase [Deltaproteobacteria bacterium CG17_big_fil_post_rev_8_21_14_2_50_63_7]
MREASRSSYASRPRFWRSVRQEEWSSWIWQQQNRVRDVETLCQIIPLSSDEIETINWSADRFRMAITPHYLTLIDGSSLECPIRLQAIPQRGEQVRFPYELDDPLAEEKHMPVPGLTHRYPDRVLVYMTHNCPVYCRHCTRKRKVSDPQSAPRAQELTAAIAYIAGHPEVRDVLLSGGDPLSLSTRRLAGALAAIRRIDHVDVIRVGTRNPVTLPQRIDAELCEVLASVAPVYVNTQFNHLDEATSESEQALKMLREAGCILSNQMVLLAGINDTPHKVETLNRWLLRNGVRPYYIFQADMAAGITHYRTPLATGLEIMRHLRGRLSGLGVPQFVIDLPDGGGKIPISPDYLEPGTGKEQPLLFRNWQGELFEFWDVDGTPTGQSFMSSAESENRSLPSRRNPKDR